MARTLLHANRASGASVKVNPIPASDTELEDRRFRARRVAVIALEAVSAGETPLGFAQRLRLGQPRHHLGKTLHSLFGWTLGLERRLSVGVDRQFEHREGHQRWPGPLAPSLASKPRVNKTRRLLAVSDGRRHRSRGGRHVAPGKNARVPGHHVGPDQHRSIRAKFDAGDFS
jgi:hypothetical protein